MEQVAKMLKPPAGNSLQQTQPYRQDIDIPESETGTFPGTPHPETALNLATSRPSMQEYASQNSGAKQGYCYCEGSRDGEMIPCCSEGCEVELVCF